MSSIRSLFGRVFRLAAPKEPPIKAEPFYTAQDERYFKYQIGEWTYGKPRIISAETKTKLTIGKFCSIAEGVTILLGAEHRTDWITTYPFNVLFEGARHFEGHPHSKGDIVIGNDVWIGTEAFILSGVTIGDGAVIAARSVVTKDVLPYSIVGGNPARHIRFRFPDEVIKSLERIRWWDWPISRIQEAWSLLLSPEIDAFLAQYGEGTQVPDQLMQKREPSQPVAAI
jgi:virginiamycin A acetyltransferase